MRAADSMMADHNHLALRVQFRYARRNVSHRNLHGMRKTGERHFLGFPYIEDERKIAAIDAGLQFARSNFTQLSHRSHRTCAFHLAGGPTYSNELCPCRCMT